MTLSGQMIYLGEYGSSSSKREYERRLSEWLAAGRRMATDPQETTIAEIVAAFRKHARAYYRNADGEVSGTVGNFDQAFRPLLKLYGKTKAIDFGPMRLKVVRQQMVDAGRCRTNVNRHIVRVRHVFKWATQADRMTSLATIDLPQACPVPAASACPEAEAVHISHHRRNFQWPHEKGSATDITVYHLWQRGST